MGRDIVGDGIWQWEWQLEEGIGGNWRRQLEAIVAIVVESKTKTTSPKDVGPT